MSSDKMISALNEQLNRELYSSYLYLSMAAFFEEKNVSGLAKWMYAQAVEENQHGMKFFNFIIKIGGRVKLLAITEPKFEWDSPRKAFENALDHERYITKSIHELFDLAVKEKDYPAQIFLNWFVDEQVEEEQTVVSIVEKFKLIGDNKSGLYMLDRELGTRT